MLREWAAYAGNTDSVFVVPILSDGDFTYSATYKTGTSTGVDIVLTKYDKDGVKVWQILWTGSGVGRDQPSDMVMDLQNIYLSGITFTSANNYDFLTMQIKKSTGAVSWVSTYNSSFSNYDVATSIGIFGNFLYVTGITYRQNSLGDYHTIKYDLAGNLVWQQDFDYAGLMDIPFDLSINKEDTTIVITGASQSTAVDWDYQTLIYDSSGTLISQPRVSGSTAGFDRAQAVKTDATGNIYITGTTRGSNGDLDIKTVKLSATGSLLWLETFDSGNDDIGNDIIVDDAGNVYICGESHGNDKDFFVRKYNTAHHTEWTEQIDGGGQEDIAYKMCFDSEGNLIVTGKGYNPQTSNYDFLTVAFKAAGGEIWRDYFDGAEHGTDEARNITSDTSGNIFVTGQVERYGENETVTIKYRTDYFRQPPSVDSPSVAYLFYPNQGQLVDMNDSLVTDSVHYYILHHSPQLYFGYGVMNMVFSHVDQDTATVDTLQRVDVSFLNTTNVTEAFPVDEQDSAGYLNYFLGHCPQGITNVRGNGKLLYTDVYAGIDAEYSSNSGGLKLYFIVNPSSSDPSEIGLKFEGQNSINILNNWQLRVTTAIGTYDFEKPKVYQLDANNHPVLLSWHLDWIIQNGNEAKFNGWGSYDGSKPLIIEIGKAIPNFQTVSNNLYWSTYYGGNVHELSGVIVHDNQGYFYTSSTTSSFSIPLNNGFQTTLKGATDILLSQFSETQGPITNLRWATYFGGDGIEDARGIAVNNTTNNIYFTGSTNSDGNTGFPMPTNNPLGSNLFHANLQSNNSCPLKFDAFLTKVRNDGQALLYSTYIGGESCEGGFALAINQNSGEVYLGGQTQSDEINTPDFVLFPSSNTTAYNQSSYGGVGSAGYGDGFLMKFNTADQCLWSTYFGGSEDEAICGITITNDDKVFVTGLTNTPNAANPTSTGQPCLANANGDFPDCDPGGTRYYDGSFNSTSGNDFDCFVAGFNVNDQLVWSTYFGGWADDHTTAWNPIATTENPSTIFAITGGTSSSTTSTPSFPVQSQSGSYNQAYSGNLDAFVVVFNEFDLTWSTFFGGTGSEQGVGIAFDENDKLFITGSTTSGTSIVTCSPPASGEFPICDGNGVFFTDNSLNGGSDAFITGFYADHSLLWSTYMGGSGSDQGFSITAFGAKIFSYGDSHSLPPNTYQQVFQNRYYWQNANLNGGSDNFISMFKNENVISVEENNSEFFTLFLFPNPTESALEVNLNSIHGNIKGKTTYQIYDLEGRLVMEGLLNITSFNARARTIIVNEIESGMYFLKVNCENGSISSKFIKQ